MNGIVIFDGICNLCAHSVRFILNHEADQSIRFAAIQSLAGTRLMRQHGIDPEDAKTFVFLSAGKLYVKSDAAIQVSKLLRWPWKIIGAVKIIPRPVRDWAYDLIARHRYRWFGRYETCMLPSPNFKARFIDE
ncbi:MAG: thiol-disulfide oxidoreductase DCC family protein [Desulfuromusa sp.]|nr:thiol-disulfide oxidoreductase DCC family protein [Desulfuromusa sp.]